MPVRPIGLPTKVKRRVTLERTGYWCVKHRLNYWSGTVYTFMHCIQTGARSGGSSLKRTRTQLHAEKNAGEPNVLRLNRRVGSLRRLCAKISATYVQLPHVAVFIGFHSCHCKSIKPKTYPVLEV